MHFEYTNKMNLISVVMGIIIIARWRPRVQVVYNHKSLATVVELLLIPLHQI